MNLQSIFSCAVCFKVFDVNHDGKLCERELVQMVQALLRIRQENHPSDSMVYTYILTKPTEQFVF